MSGKSIAAILRVLLLLLLLLLLLFSLFCFNSGSYKSSRLLTLTVMISQVNEI